MPNYSYDLPTNYYIGGGGETSATPLALVILLLGAICIFALPRKYVLVVWLFVVTLLPLDVILVFGGLHFQAQRVLVLIGLVRILARGERFPGRLNLLDQAVLLGLLVNSICFVLVWHNLGAIVNRLGFLITSMGGYFLLRSLIRTKDDLLRVIKTLAILVIFIAPFMLREHQTQYNYFSLVGAPSLANIRNGRIRAQGPFAHAILAGTYGAVLVPVFVGLIWHSRRNLLIGGAGLVAAGLMIFACSSSTPVLAFPAGIMGLLLWRVRDRMQLVRRGIVGGLVLLQLCMKVPIWFLMEKLGFLMGGSGWHRSKLVDNFIRHFFQWFLIGTNQNANWGWSMWDVDNAYVAAGLAGGLLGLILFVLVIVRAFRTVGETRRSAALRNDSRLIWALGCALAANAMAFIGIVYFDQSVMTWYALLVMISVTRTFSTKQAVEQTEQRQETTSFTDLVPAEADSWNS